jgi:hypothetical protein
MIRYLWHRFLCSYQLHDTGTRRTGLCKRCEAYVYSDGTTRR